MNKKRILLKVLILPIILFCLVLFTQYVEACETIADCKIAGCHDYSEPCLVDGKTCQEQHPEQPNQWKCCQHPIACIDNGCLHEECACHDDCPGDAPSECVRCTLSCPNPLTEVYNSYFLTELSCTDSGTCELPTTHYKNCYEVPSPQPTTSLVINPEDIPTSYGFTSDSHTGGGVVHNDGTDDSVNEPINMVATYTDTTSSEIEALYVWFKQGSTRPVTPRVIDLDDSSAGQRRNPHSNSQFGFVMVKIGGNWTPFVTGIVGPGDGPGDRWLPAKPYQNNTFYINTSLGFPFLVTIRINSITNSGNSVVMNFDVSFHSQYMQIVDGRYYIFLMGNDTFGFTPYDNYTAYPEVDLIIRDLWSPEQIRIYNNWIHRGDWFVDLHNPDISQIDVEVPDKTKLRFSWNLNDAVGLYGVVGNLSVDFEPDDDFTVTALSTGATNTIVNNYIEEPIGDDIVIGHLTNMDNMLFRMLFRTAYKEYNGYVDLDVGANRNGVITLYLTAFDRGGNPATRSTSFDLRDWMATQGGLLYSRDGVDVTIRSIPDNLWNTTPLLERFPETRVDITSELWGERLEIAPIAPARSDLVGSYMIRPYEVTDFSSYYTILKSSFEKRRPLLQVKELNPVDVLTGSMVKDLSAHIRYMYKVGNLTVGSPSEDFVCNGRGIFFVQGNLTINGQVVNGSEGGNKDACIFVVLKDTVFNSGKNVSSGGSLRYDPVNAYILSDETTTINHEGDLIVDGLYVSGGIHSLQGFTVNRFLNLTHRLQFPVFVTDHHSKYGVFAGELFGSPVNIQKTEVGLKPF